MRPHGTLFSIKVRAPLAIPRASTHGGQESLVYLRGWELSAGRDQSSWKAQI